MRNKIIFFALGTAVKLVYIPVVCMSQLVTSNSVAITNTATITVNGDMLNNAGTTITNSGTVELSGNWTNNAGNNCFGTSAGTVILNGANQDIGGSDETAFNNLVLQGSGTKKLLHDETVGGAYVNPAGVLDLSDRFLDLNANKLTISNAAASAIARTTGFIQSETDPTIGYSFLQWNMGSSPAGSVYSFPFGNISSASYIPFDFTVTTAGTTAGDGFISVATYPTDPFQLPNNRPLPYGVNALLNTNGAENADKVVDRFWLLHAGNYATEPVSTMQFTYRSDDFSIGNNTINEANLQAQRLDGTVWSFPMTGWDTPANNTVTVDNISKYDTMWALTDNTAPLPISLLSFDAVLKKNQTVLCSWVTAAQFNNDFFDVERSKNGTDFEKVGALDGAGNSTSVLDYSFTDENPYSGLSYYRLKQVDFDGRSTYSDTKAIMIGLKGIKYYVYPNPVSSTLNLMLSEDMEFDGTLRIVDALGNVVADQNITLQDHQQLVQVDLSTLAAGNYVVQLLSQGQFEQQKISVVH